MADAMLSTAPCLPIPAPPLERTHRSSASHSRVSIRATLRPLVLRISCCSGATTSAGTVERTEECGGEGGSNSVSRFGDVYVASVPLRAPKGAAQILEAVKDLDILADFQHFMIVIKPTHNDEEPCTVLDFQPLNPEDPMTVVSVLMGGNIPGVILERTLSRLPNQRCWWVGEMKPELSLEDAVEFSRGYNSELSLGINDCRHHTLDLVEYLTGKKMNFIEEVRTVKEREQRLAEELKRSVPNSSEELADLEDIN